MQFITSVNSLSIQFKLREREEGNKTRREREGGIGKEEGEGGRRESESERHNDRQRERMYIFTRFGNFNLVCMRTMPVNKLSSSCVNDL